MTASKPVPSKPPIVRARRTRIGRADESAGQRPLPEETPIAFTYARQTQAVMLASPSDLEDFAVGFSFTERIVAAPDEIEELEIVDLANGIELRVALVGDRATQIEARRRHMAGPAGCGLCGIESLDAAAVPPPVVRAEVKVESVDIFRALAALRDHQPVNDETRGVHAAGFWSPMANHFLAVREDVGRHNALDKLAGAIARSAVDASQCALVITSRVSVEMVQKAAAIGAPLLIAVSAPTALAVRTAEAANITLIGVARHSDWEMYTHRNRIHLK